MSRKMQIHEVTEIYKNLDLTVQNKEWIDAHSEEDVKLLTDARDVTLNLLTQVGVFIDLFHQYVDLIQANAIFSEDYQEQPGQDGNLSPTQTPATNPSKHPSSMGKVANRAERRKERPSRTPLDIVNGNK